MTQDEEAAQLSTAAIEFRKSALGLALEGNPEAMTGYSLSILKATQAGADRTLEELAKVLGWKRDTCRGRHCSASVWWARTATGRYMPLEADLGIVRPHFVTCPDASSFRRR